MVLFDQPSIKAEEGESAIIGKDVGDILEKGDGRSLFSRGRKSFFVKVDRVLITVQMD